MAHLSRNLEYLKYKCKNKSIDVTRQYKIVVGGGGGGGRISVYLSIFLSNAC